MMLNDVRPGSVIYIPRPFIYDHYGIYAGHNKVIHYVKEDGSVCDGFIAETSLKEFLDGQSEAQCFVKYFPETRKALELILKQKIRNSNLLARTLNEFDKSKYHFYSDSETLQRAKKSIHSDEWKYSVVTNNCEHFSVWCKTNVKYSAQVENFFNFLLV